MVGSIIVLMAYGPPWHDRSGATLEILTLELNFISQRLGPSCPWCSMSTQQGQSEMNQQQWWANIEYTPRSLAGLVSVLFILRWHMRYI